MRTAFKRARHESTRGDRHPYSPAVFDQQDGLGEQILDVGEWLFRASGERVRLTQEGQPIPNSSYAYQDAFVSELNENEDLLMSNGSFNARELWLLDHRQLAQPQPIALPGDIAHSGNEQSTVIGIGEARMNNRGLIMGEGDFRSEFGSRFDAVWKRDEQLNILVKSGQPAPTVPGYSFELFRGLGVNDQGQGAFTATLVSDADKRIDSIWKQVDGRLELVVNSNSKLPGIPETDQIFRIGGPLLNERGQIAFEVSYGESIDSKLGVWAQDVDGDLIAVAVPDIEYRLPDGESVVFSELNGIWDFNNLGVLVFDGHTADGDSGIFQSNAVAIPEPQGFLLAIVALMLIGARRRFSSLV